MRLERRALFCFMDISDLIHRPVIFISHILKREIDVEKRRIDGSVTHESLDDRERYLLTYEVGAESMAKTVSVSVFEKS